MTTRFIEYFLEKEVVSTLEIQFLFFMNEFREGTYTPLWGVSILTDSRELVMRVADPKILVLKGLD